MTEQKTIITCQPDRLMGLVCFLAGVGFIVLLAYNASGLMKYVAVTLMVLFCGCFVKPIVKPRKYSLAINDNFLLLNIPEGEESICINEITKINITLTAGSPCGMVFFKDGRDIVLPSAFACALWNRKNLIKLLNELRLRKITATDTGTFCRSTMTGEEMNQANPRSPEKRFFITRIFPLPFLLVGALTFYFGLRGIYQAHQSTAWPVADGTVQDSTMKYHSRRKGDGTYHARVFYQFQVKGQTCSGDRVAFGDYGSSAPSHAQEIVNRYPKGQAVKVHYRPDAPASCVLEPGIHGQAWGLPLFGLFFLAAGSLAAIFLPKLLKSSSTEIELDFVPPPDPRPATLSGR